MLLASREDSGPRCEAVASSSPASQKELEETRERIDRNIANMSSSRKERVNEVEPVPLAHPSSSDPLETERLVEEVGRQETKYHLPAERSRELLSPRRLHFKSDSSWKNLNVDAPLQVTSHNFLLSLPDYLIRAIT